jgi:hypothetical protein
MNSSKENELRDRPIAALTTLFSHLPHKQLNGCREAHRVLVELPELPNKKPNELDSTTQGPDLDLFLSICQDSSEWQECQCDAHSSM